MSFDTEHVRTPGGPPETITGVPTFTELLTNRHLAGLYTSIRDGTATTGPELVKYTDVSKKTVYEYLRRLEQARLIAEAGTDGGTSVYEAQDFELTLTIRDIEVSITPALVAVVAHGDEYPVIERVRDDHGVVTLTLAHDLVRAHSDGEVTARQIASVTGLSPGTTYDLIHALYAIQDLGADDSSPTTYTPTEVIDDDEDLPDESLDQ